MFFETVIQAKMLRNKYVWLLLSTNNSTPRNNSKLLTFEQTEADWIFYKLSGTRKLILNTLLNDNDKINRYNLYHGN